MMERDWGKLAKVQDELVKHEEARRKEKEVYHKMLYKNQLQNMIRERRERQRQQAQEKPDLLSYIKIKLSLTENQEIQKKRKKQHLLENSSSYNYQTNHQRMSRMKSQQEDDKNFYRNNYRKSETEISEKKSKEIRQSYLKQHELAKTYEQQLQESNRKKIFQKLQNQKFEKIAKQIEDKRQEERKRNINKIRFGFKQNPQAYELIKHIYQQNQAEKQTFLIKIENTENNQEDQKHERFRIRQSRTLETSKFNRNIFEDKLLRKKQESNKLLLQDQYKWESIQKELEKQKDYQSRLKQERRIQLKNSLEKQITESSQSKIDKIKMSQIESKINQKILKGQKTVLPGLSQDYSLKKHEKIIQNFLRNSQQNNRRSIEYD